MIPSEKDEIELDKKYDAAYDLQESNDFEKAVESYRSIINWCNGKYENDDPFIVDCRSGLANSLHGLQRYNEAAIEYRKLLNHWRNKQGTEGVETLEIQQNLAEELHYIGEYSEAASLNQATLEARKKLDMKKGRVVDSFETTIVQDRLAANYHELGCYKAAFELYDKNHRIQSSTCREDDSGLISTRHNLALNLVAFGDSESLLRAQKLQEKNLKILKRTVGEKGEQTRKSERGLRICLEKIEKKKRTSASLSSSASANGKVKEKSPKRDGSRLRSSSSSNAKIKNSKELPERSKSLTEKIRPSASDSKLQLYPKSNRSSFEKGTIDSTASKKTLEPRGNVIRDISHNDGVTRTGKPREESNSAWRSEHVSRPVTPTNTGKGKMDATKTNRGSEKPITANDGSENLMQKPKLSPKKSRAKSLSSSAPDLLVGDNVGSSKSESGPAKEGISNSTSKTKSRKQPVVHNIPTITINSGFNYGLFDVDDDPDSESRKAADKWWGFFSQTQSFLPRRKERGHRRVRIAIIDSGFDQEHPDFQADGVKNRIIKAKSFVGGEATNDLVGHGTHVLSIFLKVAPFADFYVARVVNNNGEDIMPDHVVRAIKCATQNWDVDIVSMSFGFSARHISISEAIGDVNNVSNPNNVLFFAAASNSGVNDEIAFPASLKDVFCINSTNGHGQIKGYSPISSGQYNSFSVLGAGVTGAWPIRLQQGPSRCMSGTSFATPIAAGIAAMVLEFEEYNQLTDSRYRKELRSFDGMSLILRKLMSYHTREDYYYLKPWILFDPRKKEIMGDSDADSFIKKKIFEILDSTFKTA